MAFKWKELSLEISYSTATCEQGHFHLHHCYNMENIYCGPMRSARDGLHLAHVWGCHVGLDHPQRSSSPACSSFPSYFSQLHGSHHPLTPLFQKNEKTAHEFEGEADLFCSLLVTEGDGEDQCKASKDLPCWWRGQSSLSRQPWHLPRWHQGLAAECAGASWVEQALGDWVCLHQLLWAHLHLCSCWPGVMLGFLIRQAFLCQWVGVGRNRKGLLLAPSFSVQ